MGASWTDPGLSRFTRQRLVRRRLHGGHAMALGRDAAQLSDGSWLWRCTTCGALAPAWAVHEQHVEQLAGVCPGPASRAVTRGEGTGR